MPEENRTTLLCILDGFGLNPNPRGNAVFLAKKPNFDRIFKECPHTTLVTHGSRVGLPEGQMGNSEVGHLNIGAGRVVEQSLFRIDNALSGDFLSKSPEYITFIKKFGSGNKIHLVGLCSDGGVHSNYLHLLKLLASLLNDTTAQIVLHLITDGRDTDPTSGITIVREIEEFVSRNHRCTIASICGRFFAMDRDKRWERTQKAANNIALAAGATKSSASSALDESYRNGITDEFIEPAVINPTPIYPNDGIIFWNFRADRMRQIVRALVGKDFAGFKRDFSIIDSSRALCMTEYDKTFGIPFLFKEIVINNHLGEVIANLGLAQLRVAETEKYAHVTYFLNGGTEKELPREERVLIPSPRDVKTYDLKPEMSCRGVTEAVINGITSRKFSLIVVNFANPDMVGHTGVLEAAIKAVENVDICLGQILEALTVIDGQAIIIADHGNADQMINYEDGSPHTAHTTHPVPLIAFNSKKKIRFRDNGALCDVAPTVLELMGVAKPSEMTGRSLVENI